MARYRKALIAVGGFLLVVGKVISDGSVDAQELGEIVTAAALAFGIYRVPNAQ